LANQNSARTEGTVQDFAVEVDVKRKWLVGVSERNQKGVPGEILKGSWKMEGMWEGLE
jgi:hypothetical protein